VEQRAHEVLDVEARARGRRRDAARDAAALEALDLGQLRSATAARGPRCRTAGGGADVDAALLQPRAVVVEHPLLEDLVLLGDAVGDHPEVDLAARRPPERQGRGGGRR
jgi:hypothetical protein